MYCSLLDLFYLSHHRSDHSFAQHNMASPDLKKADGDFVVNDLGHVGVDPEKQIDHGMGETVHLQRRLRSRHLQMIAIGKC